MALARLEHVGLERTDEYAAAAASAFGARISGSDFRFAPPPEQDPDEQMNALAGFVIDTRQV